jgi:hypothetical protein
MLAGKRVKLTNALAYSTYALDTSIENVLFKLGLVNVAKRFFFITDREVCACAMVLSLYIYML